MRIALAISLAFGLALSAVSPAAAQDERDPVGLGTGDELAPLLVTTAVLGSVWLGFVVADTVSFAGHTPFDVELAVSDLVLGTLAIGAGVAALVYATWIADAPILAGVGAGVVTLGAYEIGHGLWSLGAPHHGEIPPSVSVLPTQGGAMISLAGRF